MSRISEAALRSPKLLFIVLLIQGACLTYTARYAYPTYDEWMYVPSGVYHWQHGDFQPYRVNPPLPRLIAAIPLILTGVDVPHHGYMSPGHRIEVPVSDLWIERYGAATLDQMFLARLAVIPLTLLGTWFVYKLAGGMFGRGAQLVAAVLWAFSPTVLAYGALATPDIPSACALLLCCWAFYRWILTGTKSAAVVFGFSFGLLLLCKSTWILLFVGFPVMLLLFWIAKRGVHRPPLMQLGLALVIALFVLNAGYAFEGTGKRLGAFEFVCEALTETDGKRRVNRFHDSVLGQVPVPLPENFVLGIDTQKLDFEVGYPCYFWGQWRSEGVWYYYVFAFIWKEPITLLMMLVISGAAFVRIRKSRFAFLGILLLPSGLLFLLASVETGIHQHYRYVLPILPLIFLFVSGCYSLSSPRIRALLFLCLIGYAGSGLSMVPRTHAYFSPIAGGGLAGWDYLSDSNIDWGQDLRVIADYVQSEPNMKPVHVLHLTRWDLDRLGIPCISRRVLIMRPLVSDPAQWVPSRTGIYIVSPTEYIREKYRYFRETQPIEELTGGIRVYEVRDLPE